MKILSTTNKFSIYKVPFKASTVIQPNINNDNNIEPKKPQIPHNHKSNGFVRKTILGLLLYQAFSTDPLVRDIFKSQDQKMDDKARDEYFEAAQKYANKKSPAAGHLFRIADIEKDTKIYTYGYDLYSLKIPLDKGDVNIKLLLDNYDKNVIKGYFQPEQYKMVPFKAVFSKENPSEFKVVMSDKNSTEYIFGRNSNGELYQVKGNKKIILNSKNVENYKKAIEEAEKKQDFPISEKTNNRLRKLNYLLLIFLVLRERKIDKKKQENNN